MKRVYPSPSLRGRRCTDAGTVFKSSRTPRAAAGTGRSSGLQWRQRAARRSSRNAARRPSVCGVNDLSLTTRSCPPDRTSVFALRATAAAHLRAVRAHRDRARTRLNREAAHRAWRARDRASAASGTAHDAVPCAHDVAPPRARARHAARSPDSNNASSGARARRAARRAAREIAGSRSLTAKVALARAADRAGAAAGTDARRAPTLARAASARAARASNGARRRDDQSRRGEPNTGATRESCDHVRRLTDRDEDRTR